MALLISESFVLLTIHGVNHTIAIEQSRSVYIQGWNRVKSSLRLMTIRAQVICCEQGSMQLA